MIFEVGDLYNYPEHSYNASGDSLRYIYSADGEKLYVMKKSSSGPWSGTEHVANYRFENDCLTMIHTEAIHLVLRKQDYDNEAAVRMEITDCLLLVGEKEQVGLWQKPTKGKMHRRMPKAGGIW